MSSTPDWKVAGVYFEACNCERVCPCYVGDDPTEGYCEGPCVWHVKKGAYGSVPLDGLNVVMLQRCEGNMYRNEWECWYYIDDEATDEQFEALERIFTGQVGGHIEDFFGALWKPQRVERATVEVDLDGWQPRASIAEKLRAAVGVLSPDAGPTLCYVPNTPGVSATAAENWFDGDELQFDHESKNALTTTFEYRSG